MNIEEYREYCISKKGATESFPFPKLKDVLVFKVGGKMFTVTDISSFDSFSVKCDPRKVDELRASYPAVQKPSYMNKQHWNRVLLDNSVPDKLLRKWIDDSYNLIVSKLTKEQKEKL